LKYLILKLNNQTHALKDRDTICAYLNDYMTVEAIKSNIGEESEIDIRASEAPPQTDEWRSIFLYCLRRSDA